MSTTGNRQATQSLGAWLAKLSAGDACPCCGAPLQSVSRRRGSFRGSVLTGPARGRDAGESAAEDGAQARSDDLACPGCGCEIDAEETASGSAGCGLLTEAA